MAAAAPPGPAGGATALPRPLAAIRGLLLRGGKGTEGKERRGDRRGKGEGRKGCREKEGRRNGLYSALTCLFARRPCRQIMFYISLWPEKSVPLASSLTKRIICYSYFFCCRLRPVASIFTFEWSYAISFPPLLSCALSLSFFLLLLLNILFPSFFFLCDGCV